jgi:hypothetical protein
MMAPVTRHTRHECECSATGSGAACALNCSLHTGQFGLREDAGGGGMVGGAPVDEIMGVGVSGELGAGVGVVAGGGDVGVEEGMEGEVGEAEGGNAGGTRGALASTHAEVFSADKPAWREIESKGRRVRLCRA